MDCTKTLGIKDFRWKLKSVVVAVWKSTDLMLKKRLASKKTKPNRWTKKIERKQHVTFVYFVKRMSSMWITQNLKKNYDGEIINRTEIGVTEIWEVTHRERQPKKTAPRKIDSQMKKEHFSTIFSYENCWWLLYTCTIRQFGPNVRAKEKKGNGLIKTCSLGSKSLCFTFCLSPSLSYIYFWMYNAMPFRALLFDRLERARIVYMSL